MHLLLLHLLAANWFCLQFRSWTSSAQFFISDFWWKRPTVCDLNSLFELLSANKRRRTGHVCLTCSEATSTSSLRNNKLTLTSKKLIRIWMLSLYENLIQCGHSVHPEPLHCQDLSRPQGGRGLGGGGSGGNWGIWGWKGELGVEEMGGGSPANDLKSLTGQRSSEDPLPGDNRVLFFLRAGRVQPLTPRTSRGDELLTPTLICNCCSNFPCRCELRTSIFERANHKRIDLTRKFN